MRGGGDRGVAGAGRPAAERAGDAGPAGGRRGRLALAGGRALARPAGRLAAGAGRGRVGAALGRAWGPVYGWFRRGLELGLFDALLREVARRRRRKAGRRPGPTLAIIDTQAVRCVGVRGPRGGARPPGRPQLARGGGARPPASRRVDRGEAAKGVVGRKRVALVDAEGTWLAVAVVPASVQD